METMLSVMVWLFCNDSLTSEALFRNTSIACGTPIFFFFRRRRPPLLGERDSVRDVSFNLKKKKLIFVFERFDLSGSWLVAFFRIFCLFVQFRSTTKYEVVMKERRGQLVGPGILFFFFAIF